MGQKNFLGVVAVLCLATTDQRSDFGKEIGIKNIMTYVSARLEPQTPAVRLKLKQNLSTVVKFGLFWADYY